MQATLDVAAPVRPIAGSMAALPVGTVVVAAVPVDLDRIADVIRPVTLPQDPVAGVAR